MTAVPEIVANASGKPAWTAAVGALCIAAASAVVAWALLSGDGPTTRKVLLVALGSVLVATGATVLRQPRGRLRWDGQQWWHDVHDGKAEAGALDVAIDLGRWMLLRFRPETSRLGLAATWWPVGRGADPHGWHALRCAVYSPRPAGGAAAADLPSLPE